MNPKSFVTILTRRYRVFYSLQGKSWYAAFHDGQKRQRVSLGARTKPEAEAAVQALDKPPEQQVMSQNIRLTWKEFAATYLAFKTGQGRAPDTIKRYKAGLDAFGRHLGVLRLTYHDQVNLMVLEGYTAYRTQTEECDIKTAYNDALIIKGALKWAAKPSRGLLKANPALDWETPEPVKPKRRMYTEDDVVKMECGVRTELRPVITVLAWTGMRIGELTNLQWSDVDLEARIIHIRIRDDWKPKGRTERRIPIHPKVDVVLRNQPIGKFVFRGVRGPVLQQEWALKALKIDQRKLGLKVGDLHGFRRFFATTMMRNGVDAETVRQWGGWKSLETMLRYLADVDVKDSIAAMDRMVRRAVVS